MRNALYRSTRRHILHTDKQEIKTVLTERLAFRLTPEDSANVATIAATARQTTGRAFVSRTDVLRLALRTAAAPLRVAEEMKVPHAEEEIKMSD